MEVLNTTIFYILTLITLISAAFCLFQKNTMNFYISAMLVFLGLSGFYFILSMPYLACIQMLLWAPCMVIFMLFSASMTNPKNDKKEVLFSLKTLFAAILAVIFIFLTLPFILYQFKEHKTLQSFGMFDFALNLYKNNPLIFEITGILIFTAIIGATAVITIKNTRKSSKKGENI